MRSRITIQIDDEHDLTSKLRVRHSVAKWAGNTENGQRSEHLAEEI